MAERRNPGHGDDDERSSCPICGADIVAARTSCPVCLWRQHGWIPAARDRDVGWEARPVLPDIRGVYEAWGWLAPGLDREELERAVNGANCETEQKVAKKYGVPAVVVPMAATGRWGRTFTAERERRVSDLVLDDASPRSLQALRGHVTRDLLDELDPLLELAARHAALRRV